jgi:hypothetical protein
MFSITYISFSTQPFSARELLDLLAFARENNGKLAVTGMLLYREGSFMQVLEGRPANVHRLYTRIESDLIGRWAFRIWIPLTRGTLPVSASS